jgi:hypothetical protein
VDLRHEAGGVGESLVVTELLEDSDALLGDPTKLLETARRVGVVPK